MGEGEIQIISSHRLVRSFQWHNEFKAPKDIAWHILRAWQILAIITTHTIEIFTVFFSIIFLLQHILSVQSNLLLNFLPKMPCLCCLYSFVPTLPATWNAHFFLLYSYLLGLAWTYLTSFPRPTSLLHPPGSLLKGEFSIPEPTVYHAL